VMTFCDVSIWGRKATLSRVTVYGFASVVLAPLALANPVPVRVNRFETLSDGIY